MESMGLKWLATEEERAERNAALKGKGQMLKLRYLKGSEKMGKSFGIDCRLWDVLAPELPGYPESGGQNGYPTLSLDGMQKLGLIKGALNA